jgi:DNA-binding transcriptional MerR regulator
MSLLTGGCGGRVRIAELSRQTGVSIPTIKFYLRAGLLPPGEFTSPNQAHYDDRHVRRLVLVRALVEVGRVPIAGIRDLLAELDGDDPDVHRVLGHALKSSVALRSVEPSEALDEARRRIEELVAKRGWQVLPDTPARQAAAEAIAAFEQVGGEQFLRALDEYAEVAERIAAIDLELVKRYAEPEQKLQAAVVGAILGEPLLAALRRLAQEDASARLFGHTAPCLDEADSGQGDVGANGSGRADLAI